MQSLDIITVNLWQILISLANLLIIFLILKRFLYKPVKKVLDERRQQIDAQYSEADAAVKKATADREEYEKKLADAHDRADRIIKDATANAERRADSIVADAKSKADVIVKHAETDAELTHKKAQAQIRREIADVSVAISEKMLEREINADDHSALIDSVIGKIGEDDDQNV